MQCFSQWAQVLLVLWAAQCLILLAREFGAGIMDLELTFTGDTFNECAELLSLQTDKVLGDRYHLSTSIYLAVLVLQLSLGHSLHINGVVRNHDYGLSMHLIWYRRRYWVRAARVPPRVA